MVLFCYNDFVVFGVLNVVWVFGIGVFEQVFVFGFDDVVMLLWQVFDFIIVCQFIFDMVYGVVELFLVCFVVLEYDVVYVFFFCLFVECFIICVI